VTSEAISTPRGGEQRLDVAAGHVFADDERVAPLLPGVEDADDVGVVSEPAHRLRLAPRPGLDRRGDVGGVEEGNRDLAAVAVGGEVDALAGTLAEEALHPVAPLGELVGDVGRKLLLPRSIDLRALRLEPGPAGVAELRPVAVVGSAGGTAHRVSKSTRCRGP
jgi:hypothetical protein